MEGVYKINICSAAAVTALMLILYTLAEYTADRPRLLRYAESSVCNSINLPILPDGTI